ncbi:hypothetical protein FB451DRAFT_1407714 [Mycena latifolia]|nr:hypothetical protein FB451DRAFT_1407714 [Mycena latifolia]
MPSTCRPLFLPLDLFVDSTVPDALTHTSVDFLPSPISVRVLSRRRPCPRASFIYVAYPDRGGLASSLGRAQSQTGARSDPSLCTRRAGVCPDSLRTLNASLVSERARAHAPFFLPNIFLSNRTPETPSRAHTLLGLLCRLFTLPRPAPPHCPYPAHAHTHACPYFLHHIWGSLSTSPSIHTRGVRPLSLAATRPLSRAGAESERLPRFLRAPARLCTPVGQTGGGHASFSALSSSSARLPSAWRIRGI